MTLRMADSIRPQDLPGGYDAYLGYVDGYWPTSSALRAAHAGAHILTLTVLGGNAVADGCDRETGDLSAPSAVAWAQRRIAAGAWRPVIYASASAMAEVLADMAATRVPRPSVRLLSAHYGAGQHICGPSTCGQVSVPMDGTQWTDSAPGNGGTRIDASVLLDGFFGAASPAPPPPTSWQETMMNALPVLKQGATGASVRTVQGLLVARGYPVTVDGALGPATDGAVKRFQSNSHLGADGIVGPQTWPALMGV